MAKKLLLRRWNSSSDFPSAPACINPLDGEFAASETPAPIHALPITMKAPLFLYILFALLDLGACLQCEVCTGFGRNCTGSMETCSSGEDSCAITVFESLIVGFNIQQVTKSCMASSECRASPVVVRFGEETAIRKSTTCCVGDACSTDSVTMPPADTTSNGWRCPACSSVFIPCSEETLDCTGSETQCIAVTGSIAMGKNSPRAERQFTPHQGMYGTNPAQPHRNKGRWPRQQQRDLLDF
ncbi:phospholipase A2 inhibitor and Ly6/PLAUR domain-containing protein-like isoform X3 [Lepidochelys kempii]|uniref:phospholipase A2 inhibitor and Ly6/PLAUR domain-containing protein-like isoform X3 n=1 Tax=Lepidochelys kempii TaxID=8472 RepID=UPI003C6EBA14